jgi:hypothetical protein
MNAEPMSWKSGSRGSSRCTQQYPSGKLHQLSDLQRTQQNTHYVCLKKHCWFLIACYAAFLRKTTSFAVLHDF